MTGKVNNTGTAFSYTADRLKAVTAVMRDGLVFRRLSASMKYGCLVDKIFIDLSKEYANLDDRC